MPPIAEQRCIVAKVEQLLARVNAARERLGRVPAILKRFRQSVLAAASSGLLTADWREKHQSAGRVLLSLSDDLPVGWRFQTLKDLTLTLQKGWSPQCENFSTRPKFGAIFRRYPIIGKRLISIQVASCSQEYFEGRRGHVR